MKNELYRHKKSDKIKWIITAVAGVLFAVLLAGVCLQVFGHGKLQPSEWFKKPETTQTAPETDGVQKLATAYTAAYNSENIMISNALLNADWSFSERAPAVGSVPLVDRKSGFVKYIQLLAYPQFGDRVSQVENTLIYEWNLMVDLAVDYDPWDGVSNCELQITIGNTQYKFSFQPVFGYRSGYFCVGTVCDADPQQYGPGEFLEDMGIQSCIIYCDDNRVVYPLPDDPVKEGYTFLGWYNGAELACDGNCTKYDSECIYDDTVLHAHWQINTYTVTYNSDGGSSVSSITVDWNTVLTPPMPTKTGYNFTGWYLADGTKYENQPIKENTALTAHWEVKTFTVTFYVDGEKYSEIVVNYGERLKKIEEQANAQNLQVTTLRMNSGAPITDLTEFSVTEDIEVQAEVMTGTDKVKNTVKNNWLTIVLSAGGVVALIVLISALCSRKKKKTYRY